jgi:predicted nucleic acid-binding protein
VIIVSDSGPLAYLVQIGVADSLPILYGQVYITPVVLSELRHQLSPATEWAHDSPEWLVIAKPRSVLIDLALDDGEREAIALALELGADFLLMDERKGRSAAKMHGLKVAGTLAVILDGASRQMFDGMKALEDLESTNFYASAELLQLIRKKLQS